MNDAERLAWLEERRKGIGASDAAAVCGATPWRTPLEVYLDKTGQLVDKPMTAAQRIGLLLEPAVSQLYEDATGRKLVIPPASQVSADHPVIRANPDRMTDDGVINVQLKTAGFRTDEWGETGTDEVPMHYLIQVQHEMIVTGQKMSHLAVLFLQTREFAYYVIEAYNQLQTDIITVEEDFWRDFVLKQTPPEPTWKHPTTLDLIRRYYRKVAGGEVGELAAESTAAFVMMCGEYKACGDAITKMKAQQDEIKSRLLWEMKELAMLKIGTEFVVTRKEIEKKAYTVGAMKYMDVRIKEAKKAKGEE